ncbi:MAG: flagellin, partial [Desulfobulbaceae bacterium]|nr:flagellin [Desulfobulbaceae bacterium]
QIRGMNQAVRNANDGISLAQTAEGALQETTNILQRMRELAVQSANDTNTGTDRTSIQKEIVQLQAEINRIAGTTAFNNRLLLDGSFGSAKFHVGANANQSISATIGDARATSMGSNRLVNEYVTGGLSTAVAATSNTEVGTDVTIAGSVGSKLIAIGADDSARDIAAAVNANTDETGVSSSAVTYAKIDNISAGGGTVSIALNGQNEAAADAVTVSATVTTGTDLTELAKAINDVVGTTGITATLSDDKSAILLENADGYDITMNSQAGSVQFDLTGVEESGTHASGEDFFSAGSEVDAAISVTAGSDVTVGGSVIFDAAKSYTITAADALGGLFDDTTAHGSTLKAVSTIDVSSQTGANQALSIVDSALTFVDDLRADLGALQNRFESTIANLMNVSENISAAKSRIVDADFALETATLTKAQILQQAGIAMLAQANTIPQAALTLLQG